MPYVPNNHQYKNAHDLEVKGAAILLEEKDMNSTVLVNMIDNVLNNDVKVKEMKEALKDMSVNDSATRIYRELKKKCGL